jgi:hypothetical protein
LGDVLECGKAIKSGSILVRAEEVYGDLKGIKHPGKLGGPLHRATIDEISKYFISRGYKVTPEAPIKTPEGALQVRYGDLLIENPVTNQRLVVQVGVGTKAGDPLARERAAIEDLYHQGYSVWFEPYK